MTYGHEVGPCKTDTCYHHKDFSADTNLRPIASLKMALTFDPLEQVLQLEQLNMAVFMSRYALARVVLSIVT